MRTRIAFLVVLALFAAFTLSGQTSAQADTFGSGSNAFTIDFVNIGNPGNAAQSATNRSHANSGGDGYGAVPYEYRMGTYEITQDAITKATASGMAGVRAGYWTGNQPAALITWYEAAAFVNWLNTSKGYTPAYNLVFNGDWSMISLWSSADAWTAGGTNLYRHKDAVYFLPNENEWYKAAYYNPVGSIYFLYPTASDTAPTSVASGTSAGTAVYSNVTSVPAIVDSAGGLSPYGTMGQGGNVWEWNENAHDGTNNSPSENRAIRGGYWIGTQNMLRSFFRNYESPLYSDPNIGFRVASVASAPTPITNTILTVAATNGSATLTWDTGTTGPANVEHSTDLSGWTTISTNNSTGSFQHAFGNATKGFYRLRWTPSTPPPPTNMALIPAGTFQMGNTLSASGEGSWTELPVHAVNVSAFYMDKYEVTKALWDEVATWAAANGYDIDAASADGKAANHPAYNVSWHEAVKWSNARSQKEGLTPCYTVSGAVMKTGTSAPECNFAANGYRLPTEAEWEKAARGGLSGKRFPWGDTITHSEANYNSSSSYAYDVSPTGGLHPIYNDGVYPYSSPVGSFAPNGYGLSDMMGNVQEWCWDYFDAWYYAGSPPSDPRGPSYSERRTKRGGSWLDYVSGTRTASRGESAPTIDSYVLGFRCVRSSVP